MLLTVTITHCTMGGSRLPQSFLVPVVEFSPCYPLAISHSSDARCSLGEFPLLCILASCHLLAAAMDELPLCCIACHCKARFLHSSLLSPILHSPPRYTTASNAHGPSPAPAFTHHSAMEELSAALPPSCPALMLSPSQALLSSSLHSAPRFITPIADSFYFPSGCDEKADESALFLIHVNSPFPQTSPPAALG